MIPNDDDIYVNDGETYNGVYYPKPPAERIEAENAQEAAVRQSLPIMDDVADWFQDQIVHCSDIDNIQTTAITHNGTTYSRAVSIEAQVLAYQLLKQLLTEKANEWSRFTTESSNV